jgi:predicted dehydrogenase
LTPRDAPIRVGLIGVGGYGQQHLDTLRTLETAGLCRLVAVADPFAAARHPETVEALRARDADVHADPDTLVARGDIDVVFIATPIPLHAPQTIRALEAGKHVYLEKPPCATLGEWKRMETAREASGRLCAVGFQMQTSPALRTLKRHLVAGTLGELRTVWSAVRWRREDAYYARAAWAGRWSVSEGPVFDGPATNALAHVVHAALFLAGSAEEAWAELARVRGALRRARPVESYDSAFLEAETAASVRVRLCFTHASSRHDEVAVRCRGTKGSAEIHWNGRLTITGGEAPRTLALGHQSTVAAPLGFLRSIATGGAHPPFTTLHDTLPYLQMVNGALLSSGGAAPRFPADRIVHHNPGTPQSHYEVPGLDDEIERFRQDPDAPPPLLAGDGIPWVAISEIPTTLVVREPEGTPA